MKKVATAVIFTVLATTCFVVQSHAEYASSRNLYFYGARLPNETVQVAAYA
jgi:hypothetical protein